MRIRDCTNVVVRCCEGSHCRNTSVNGVATGFYTVIQTTDFGVNNCLFDHCTTKDNLNTVDLTNGSGFELVNFTNSEVRDLPVKRTILELR